MANRTGVHHAYTLLNYPRWVLWSSIVGRCLANFFSRPYGGQAFTGCLIIYLRKVMIRDNVVKIKMVDKAKAFVRDYLADGAKVD
jgi:hypothetical protein